MREARSPEDASDVTFGGDRRRRALRFRKCEELSDVLRGELGVANERLEVSPGHGSTEEVALKNETTAFFEKRELFFLFNALGNDREVEIAAEGNDGADERGVG